MSKQQAVIDLLAGFVVGFASSRPEIQGMSVSYERSGIVCVTVNGQGEIIRGKDLNKLIADIERAKNDKEVKKQVVELFEQI